MARLIAHSARFRGVAVVVIAGMLAAGSAAIAGAARSAPRLPSITPQVLLANLIGSVARDPAISGNVTANVDLGLPSIPNEGSGAATGPAAILASLSGDQRLRVWHSRDGARL